MIYLHIFTGLAALLAGWAAIMAAKGSFLHRKSGTLFVWTMLIMATTGGAMSIWMKPNRVNVVASILTVYLVITGWLAVKKTIDESRGLTSALAAGGALSSLYALTLAASAIQTGTRVDGLPAAPLILFGLVGLLAVLGDVRALLAPALARHVRIARHLWRLGFALLIANMAFFLGQAKVFPEPLRKIALLATPVLTLIVVLIYWMWRVHRGAARRAIGGVATP
jgi:uncharacterized membrane protein